MLHCDVCQSMTQWYSLMWLPLYSFDFNSNFFSGECTRKLFAIEKSIRLSQRSNRKAKIWFDQTVQSSFFSTSAGTKQQYIRPTSTSVPTNNTFYFSISSKTSSRDISQIDLSSVYKSTGYVTAFVKWGAPSRWSISQPWFCRIFAWGSTETTAIEKTQPTLFGATCVNFNFS